MTFKHLPLPRKGGFALIVVLSSLAILAILFGISSKRSITTLAYQSAETHLLHRSSQNAEILLRAGDEVARSETIEGRYALTVEIGDDRIDLEILDVGGLIDLNTASPSLIEALFSALDFPSDASTKFRRWRQTPHRLLRLDDIPRIVGAENADLALLRRVATVHSGRTGIAPDSMTPELEGLLSNRIEFANFETPLTGSNYAVFLIASDNRVQRAGIMELDQAIGKSRILLAD